MSCTISVITSVYEGNRYLPALCGMMARNAGTLGERASLEYIIVNDSPWEKVVLPESDGSFSLSVIDNPENCGIHRSRIRGIAAAKGDYVLILDQDDAIEDDCLLSQLEAIGDRDVVVSNGVKELDGGDKRIYRDRWKMSLVNREIIYLLAANQIVSPGQCLLRKNAIPAAWLENPMEKNGSDDLFLWLLYLERGTRFALNPRSLYVHKQVGDNLSNDLRKMCESDREMCEILERKGLLSPRSLGRRRRMVAFIAASGYTQKITLPLLLAYPDVILVKLFAYFI